MTAAVDEAEKLARKDGLRDKQIDCTGKQGRIELLRETITEESANDKVRETTHTHQRVREREAGILGGIGRHRPLDQQKGRRTWKERGSKRC